MQEKVIVETLFRVWVRDFDVHHDSPIQGACEIENQAASSLGPFDTREQAVTVIEEEKAKLLQESYWQEATNEPRAAGGLWNDWKKHYRTFTVQPEKTELSRELLIPQPAAV